MEIFDFELLPATKEVQEVEIPDHFGDWIKINHEAMGFFRVKYDENMLSELLKVATTLPVLDKMNLLADTLQLAISGISPTTELLDVLDIFCQSEENSGDVWMLIYDAFSSLESVFLCNDEELRNLFFRYASSCFQDALDRIGRFTSPLDTQDDVKARYYLWYGLARYGDEEIVPEARQMFDQDPFEVDVDLQRAVYRAIVLGDDFSDNQQYHEKLMSLYSEASFASHKSRITTGLTSVEDRDLIERTLDMAMNDTIVRTQDFSSFFAKACGCKGRRVVWEYFQHHFEEISSMDTAAHGFVGAMIRGFATQEEYDEIEAYFSTHNLTGTSGSIEQGLASVLVNKKWVERDLGHVDTWLNNHFAEEDHTQSHLLLVGIIVLLLILLAIGIPAIACRKSSTTASNPAYVDLDDTFFTLSRTNGHEIHDAL